MAVRLIESLATTEELAQIFSDESVLQAMLDFEAALARAEAQLNIIPASVAEAIAGIHPCDFDAAALSRGAIEASTPGVPFAKALTELVRKKESTAAAFVHWGATSQDVCDTALILLLKRAQPVLEADLGRLEENLRRISKDFRATLMLSRTLLQPAPPTTFGLKAAGWLAAIHRSHRRLRTGFSESLIVQFGGASGTLAALGKQGVAVGQRMAGDLGLAFPEAPWHAHRDRLATLVCACGVLGGALGKMARDIGLMTQDGVGEVVEPSGPGRGRSSTLPHKQNPVGSAVTLAAANRLPGLVASFLAGMAQEHERALGGWQAEWPTLASAVQTAGLAVAAMADVAEGLTVNAERMRANLDLTHGIIFAERALMLMKRRGVDDAAARKSLELAARKCTEQGRGLRDVLAEMPEIRDRIDPADFRDLENPEHYLGVADEFQDRLLASVEETSAAEPDRGKE